MHPCGLGPEHQGVNVMIMIIDPLSLASHSIDLSGKRRDHDNLPFEVCRPNPIDPSSILHDHDN